MGGYGAFIKNKFFIISNITENITWDYDPIKIQLKEKVVRIRRIHKIKIYMP